MPDRHYPPPPLAERLAGRALDGEEQAARLGDLEERFQYLARERDGRNARAWYRRQVLRLVLLAGIDNTKWSGIMLKSYIKTAFRNIRRNRGFSFINIVGLSCGLACSVLILLWAKDELSTDRYQAKLKSLYLIETVSHASGRSSRHPGTVPALAPALKAEYPEIRNAARFINGESEFLLASGERRFRELVQLADPEIFRMFTFPFVQGRLEDAFGDSNVLVLSEKMADKIFKGENAVGRILTLNDKEEFRVVGVMKNIPHNSTLRFDIWAPLGLYDKWSQPGFTASWNNHAFRAYVEMAEGTDIDAFNKKIFDRIRLANPGDDSEPVLFPYGKVYLESWGRETSVRVFSLIALAILIIAAINFMNLSTARSSRRAREVGLRKVVGARRSQVMRQFFGESLIFTFLSLGLALLMISLVLPAFRRFTAKPFPAEDLFDPGLILGILAVSVATGLLSGSYPALLLSAFRPALVLKGGGAAGAAGGAFRKALVVFQFAMSTILMIGAIVIASQWHYIKQKNLGFDRERLVYVRLEGRLLESVVPLKNEILRFPGVESATATNYSPLGIYNNGTDWDWEGRDPNLNPQVTYFGVDPDFLKTFHMELVRGNSFPPASDHALTSVIINERFAGLLGKSDVIGSRLSQPGLQFQVIGVVKDFHFLSLFQEIEPAIIFFDPTYKAFEPYQYLFARLRPGSVQAALAHIEKTVRSFNPGYPFAYRFLDDDFDAMYKTVVRELAVVRAFTLLAVLISGLGLFGLAAYTAERRTKEIGIRKTMGASSAGIAALLSREYAKLVLTANIIAWPIAYFLMKAWLRDYHYRITLGLPLFLAAAVASIAIAQLTVSFQAVKAARIPPAQSLRNE